MQGVRIRARFLEGNTQIGEFSDISEVVTEPQNKKGESLADSPFFSRRRIKFNGAAT